LTGGKQRMGGISRAGDERLCRLLVVGSTAVIRQAAAGRGNASAWLLNLLLQRRPRKAVAVALSNKMARVAWAMPIWRLSGRSPEPFFCTQSPCRTGGGGLIPDPAKA